MAEAEMEFLKKASKLETYGIDPYAVTVSVFIIVHCLG